MWVVKNKKILEFFLGPSLILVLRWYRRINLWKTFGAATEDVKVNHGGHAPQLQNQSHILHHSEPQIQTNSDLRLFFTNAVWFELTIQTVRKTSSFFTFKWSNSPSCPSHRLGRQECCQVHERNRPAALWHRHCTLRVPSYPPQFPLSNMNSGSEGFIDSSSFGLVFELRDTSFNAQGEIVFKHGRDMLTYDAWKAPFCMRWGSEEILLAQDVSIELHKERKHLGLWWYC